MASVTILLLAGCSPTDQTPNETQTNETASVSMAQREAWYLGQVQGFGGHGAELLAELDDAALVNAGHAVCAKLEQGNRPWDIVLGLGRFLGSTGVESSLGMAAGLAISQNSPLLCPKFGQVVTAALQNDPTHALTATTFTMEDFGGEALDTEPSGLEPTAQNDLVEDGVGEMDSADDTLVGVLEPNSETADRLFARAGVGATLVVDLALGPGVEVQRDPPVLVVPGGYASEDPFCTDEPRSCIVAYYLPEGIDLTDGLEGSFEVTSFSGPHQGAFEIRLERSSR